MQHIDIYCKLFFSQIFKLNMGEPILGYLNSHGMNKETGGVARQFVPGVVQSADGLPLMHTVHPGNVSETKTLQGMLQKVLARFPVQRIILVCGRPRPPEPGKHRGVE